MSRQRRRAMSGAASVSTPSLLPLLLLGLAMAQVTSNNELEQQVCVTGKKVSLSLDYATNITGHPKIKARLEQPAESTGWQLDVELAASSCGPGGVPRKILTFTLDGSPVIRPPPPGYLTLPGLGHYRVPPQAVDWFEASALCAREGATLAVPASAREAEVLLSQFGVNATGASYLDYAWHGTNDFAQEGKFVTDTGLPLDKTGYSKFHPGQPSGGTAENCLVLVKSNALLADAPCSWKLSYYCKVSL